MTTTPDDTWQVDILVAGKVDRIAYPNSSRGEAIDLAAEMNGKLTRLMADNEWMPEIFAIPRREDPARGVARSLVETLNDLADISFTPPPMVPLANPTAEYIVGRWVKVNNGQAAWEGYAVAASEEPTVIIERPHADRLALPLTCVTEASGKIDRPPRGAFGK